VFPKSPSEHQLLELNGHLRILTGSQIPNDELRATNLGATRHILKPTPLTLWIQKRAAQYGRRDVVCLHCCSTGRLTAPGQMTIRRQCTAGEQRPG
jgi:hypothetical protein